MGEYIAVVSSFVVTPIVIVPASLAAASVIGVFLIVAVVLWLANFIRDVFRALLSLGRCQRAQRGGEGAPTTPLLSQSVRRLRLPCAVPSLFEFRFGLVMFCMAEAPMTLYYYFWLRHGCQIMAVFVFAMPLVAMSVYALRAGKLLRLGCSFVHEARWLLRQCYTFVFE